MRDVPQRWQSWRLSLVPASTPTGLPPAIRFRANMTSPEQPPTAAESDPTDFRRELPNASGIRLGLVAHIGTLIAAGQYDTPERWALAEELMFRRMEESR